MNQTLPSEAQIAQLKRELNFLLWTNDRAELPVKSRTSPDSGKNLEKMTVNTQSVAHALITAGLFVRRGFTVVSRSGAVFIIERGRDEQREKDHLNQLTNHWWLTLAEHGVVDLSLRGTSENPLVYCNRSPGGSWNISFGDEQTKLDKFIQAKEQGCFYFTFTKKKAKETELANEMARGFIPAQKMRISLCHRQVLEHCEKLLAGTAETLSGLSQKEAWEKLASTTEPRSERLDSAK